MNDLVNLAMRHAVTRFGGRWSVPMTHLGYSGNPSFPYRTATGIWRFAQIKVDS